MVCAFGSVASTEDLLPRDPTTLVSEHLDSPVPVGETDQPEEAVPDRNGSQTMAAIDQTSYVRITIKNIQQRRPGLARDWG